MLYIRSGFLMCFITYYTPKNNLINILFYMFGGLLWEIELAILYWRCYYGIGLFIQLSALHISITLHLDYLALKTKIYRE